LNFDNVFAVYLDALAQSPFPGVKGRFEFDSLDRMNDLPDGLEEWFVGVEFSSGHGAF
jgi:hypothetical protein